MSCDLGNLLVSSVVPASVSAFAIFSLNAELEGEWLSLNSESGVEAYLKVQSSLFCHKGFYIKFYRAIKYLWTGF